MHIQFSEHQIVILSIGYALHDLSLKLSWTGYLILNSVFLSKNNLSSNLDIIDDQITNPNQMGYSFVPEPENDFMPPLICNRSL